MSDNQILAKGRKVANRGSSWEDYWNKKIKKVRMIKKIKNEYRKVWNHRPCLRLCAFFSLFLFFYNIQRCGSVQGPRITPLWGYIGARAFLLCFPSFLLCCCFFPIAPFSPIAPFVPWFEKVVYKFKDTNNPIGGLWNQGTKGTIGAKRDYWKESTTQQEWWET